MKRLLLSLAPLLLLLCMGVTDCGAIIRDSGFDLWCGDHLCDWKVDQGSVGRIATWHDGDDGVALGDGASLSQVTPVTWKDGTCIKLQMVADVAPDAEVHFQMDVFADGVIDYDERIPTSSWAPLTIRVAVSWPYDGIRFRLTKTGPGRAVLADIKASTASGCPGAPIPLPPRANGNACLSGDQCTSNICRSLLLPLGPMGVCSACTVDGDCAGGEVCGLDDKVNPLLHPHLACIPAASRELGEHCLENAECATGVCSGNHVCSECDTTCPASGDVCQAVAQPTTVLYWVAPKVCLPPAGRPSGAACFDGGECASGACRGGTPFRVCDFDGRACSTDADCPAQTLTAPWTCGTVGTLGGTCQ